MHTVAVLRGGPSREHELSLASGAAMIANLDQNRYRVRDIYIDREGQWHADGRPMRPERVLRQIDVALLPLHGEYGESGEVQRLLERFGVKYAGGDSFAVSQARHKAIGKALAREAGLAVPEVRLARNTAEAPSIAAEAVRSFHQPVIVRSASRALALGVHVVAGYAPVLERMRTLFGEGADSVMVEEAPRGRGAAVCIVEGLRGEALYTCPAAALTTPDNAYPYDAGRLSEVRVSCPGVFTHVEAEELARAARLMHRALGLRHCSRSDFIVSSSSTPGQSRIHYLETSASPAVGGESIFSRALAAVGVSMRELVEHLLAKSLP